MIGGWTHRDCFVPEVYNKYIEKGNYTWHKDTSLTEVLTKEESDSGEYAMMYTDKQFHLDHCAYVWETQLWSYRHRTPVTHITYEQEHTEHCLKLFLEGLNTNVTGARRGFDWCGMPPR